MEYERKKKEILGTVEYTNLLSFALVENKLEKNFKSIVEALLLAQTEGAQVKVDLEALASTSGQEFTNLRNKIAQLENKIANLKDREVIGTSSKKLPEVEEYGFEKKSEACISSPNLNVHLVETPINTQEVIPSMKEIETENSKQNMTVLQNNQNLNYLPEINDLTEKINKLLQQQIDRDDLDKKLSNMKDNINLLKAEMKAMTDREAKTSAKRVSLLSMEKVEIVPATRSLTGSDNEQKSEGSQHSVHQVSQNLVPDNQTSNLINNLQNDLEKEINGLHIEINTMKLNIEELKESNNEIRRKDSRMGFQVEEISKNMKKLDDRMQSNNETFENQIKELKMELLNLQTKPELESIEINGKKGKNVIEAKDVSKENISPNYNNMINDRISKLQAALQGLVTDAEFKRFKTETKDKFSGLESENEAIRKELKEEIQMLTEILDNKEEQIVTMQRDIDDLKLRMGECSSQCERRNNIGVSRQEELKKNLQNLREDLEFYKSMNQTTVEPKINLEGIIGEDEVEREGKPSELSSKSVEDLKKYLNRKLHDQRSYLLGLIRDLEKKSGIKGPAEQDLANMWDKLGEINLFLSKKANEEDIKKNIGYLEKKLTALYQRITAADESNEDARIAKTNWFCLSCDKGLHSYQGKVGQHVVWDSMPVKANYTKYYNKEENKKSLPTLKR